MFFFSRLVDKCAIISHEESSIFMSGSTRRGYAYNLEHTACPIVERNPNVEQWEMAEN